jgi:hypothetical protein
MKKLKSVFLLGALAIGLGLTSCSSDDTLSSSTGEAKGNTYVAVSLTMPLSSGTRATDPNQDYNPIGQWVGNDIIKTVDIYLSDGNSVTYFPFRVGDNTTDGYTVTKNGNNIVLKPKKAIKTTPGDKSIYVVINSNDGIKTALSKSTTADFEKAYKTVALTLKNTANSANSTTSASQIASVEKSADGTSEDDIVMTNSSDASITVAAGITEAQTLTETTPQNRATVSVQRAVGRVMVTTAQDSYDVTSDPTSTTGGTKIGTITNITWVLAQGENSLYVQQNSGYTTPNYDWVPASTGEDVDYTSKAGGKYDYSGLFENYIASPKFGGTTVPTLGDYATAINAPASIGNSSIYSGKFILPTTHLYGADAGSTGYRKGNTAYVLVRAKFTPTAYVDGGTANTDGTFYVGANGKFYTKIDNAVNPATGGVKGQTVAEYIGGKVLYYAWVNPDQVPGWLNSPVLRNNIYHIHITGFKTIGTNWNPLFPEDPDHPATPENGGNPDPKPTDNPNEPTNPVDPIDPLTPTDTWMSVDVSVLPWTVHSYGVDLGI